MSASYILQTKLTPPSVRADRIHRPRLTQRFSASLDRPLTLVCAPAGYGKSTLLGEWCVSESASGVAFGWLSLDEDDNDPVRFLTYLISAFANASDIDADEMLAWLRSPQPPPPKSIVTALLSRLEAFPHPIAVVLDDYHVVTDQAVHESVSYLLAHLPARMHIVVISREDPPFPLSRLRGRGQLSEIRADDLRFTLEEAGQLLEQMLGVELSAEQVRNLDAHTEGWIAGLQLAGLAMKGRENVAGFIRAFAGSHRFILDYLTEEVLSRQPEPIQSFLLQTSVLNRLCGELCDAVTGRSDGQNMLEQIERGNLFLIPLDDARYWYRYHHLFGDTLRRHLQKASPNLVVDLHRRASQWFEQNGWVVESLEHALLSQDTQQAARLVQQTVEEITLAGQAQTILRWMNTLPEPVVRTHPRLCISYAAVLMFTHQLEASELWLQAAQQAIYPDEETEEAKAIAGWAAVIRADIARVTGDLARAVVLAQQAITLLPANEALPRAVGVMNLAHSYLSDGDVTSSVEETSEEALAALRRIGNLFATMISITNLARLQMLQGRLRQAEITFALAEHIAPGNGRVEQLLNGAAFHVGLGTVFYERNVLEAAEQHLEMGIDLVQGTLSVDADVVTAGYVTLAKLRLIQGDLSSGLASLDEFAELARVRQFYPPLIAQGAATRALLWLAQGNLSEATRWAAESGLDADDTDLTYPREREYLTLAHVLIAGGKFADARRLLNRLQQDAEHKGRMLTVIEILVLNALAWHGSGDFEQAVTALAQAVTLAEPEGYIRIFVDRGAAVVELLRQVRMRSVKPQYVTNLLDAFDHPAARVPTAAEPQGANDFERLSEREMEVLRLIADGASNREIADALFISIGTVKRHISNICLKFGTHSRTQAIATARKLNLL